MPRKVKITTRKKRTAVVATIAKTASRVLVAHGIRHTLEENLKDFVAKSSGGTDRNGDSWKPLAESTIRKKLRSPNRGPARRAILDLIKKFSIQASAAGLSPRDARQRAITAAQEFIDRPSGRDRSASVPINVDTKRMMQSLRPGSVSGRGRYTPPKEQKITATRGRVVILTEVPYAKFASKSRPIMMPAETLTQFFREGMNNAAPDAVDAIKRRL